MFVYRLFLCVTVRSLRQVVTPALFFLSLACSFALPLLESVNAPESIKRIFMLGEALTATLSFLFIVHCITGNTPKPVYWLILALPLVGGGSLIYASSMEQPTLCVADEACTETVTLKTLYGIFASSLTLLLALAVRSRLERRQPSQRARAASALTLAIVLLNIALIAIDLAQVTQSVAKERADLAGSIVRIGFLYLVLTSVFRVFDSTFSLAYERIPSIGHAAPSARDHVLADKLQKLLREENIYRSMNLSRAQLAEKLSTSEHALSRAVNACLKENITMLINRYRVEEAKLRLQKESTSITVIAFDVGFNSIPSFNRVFKQMTGMSPTEYREKKGSA